MCGTGLAAAVVEIAVASFVWLSRLLMGD